MREVTSKNRVAKRRKEAREAEAAYRDARCMAVCWSRMLRHAPRRKGQCWRWDSRRHELISNALDARRWLHLARHRLAFELKCEVVPFGGYRSPRAMARCAPR